MLLNVIFGCLALLSLVLTLWQWLVATRFPLHQSLAKPSGNRGVTLLKPLKGCDADTEQCLRSGSHRITLGRSSLVRSCLGAGPRLRSSAQTVARISRAGRTIDRLRTTGRNESESIQADAVRTARQTGRSYRQRRRRAGARELFSERDALHSQTSRWVWSTVSIAWRTRRRWR